MATYRDQGIVLKTRVLRDADRHYTLYTREHGKTTVLAKGSRRSRSKMAPHLAFFGVVDLMIARGKMIDRLAGASLARPFSGIMNGLIGTSLAQSFLLVVDALTKQELPETRVFQLIESLLTTLDGPSANRPLLFDAAVCKLLEILGFAPEISVCVKCRKALIPEGNAMNVLRGGIECRSCRTAASLPIAGDTIKALRFMLAEPFEKSALLALSPAAHREVVSLTDLLLSMHIEKQCPAIKYVRAWA